MQMGAILEALRYAVGDRGLASVVPALGRAFSQFLGKVLYEILIRVNTLRLQ